MKIVFVFLPGLFAFSSAAAQALRYSVSHPYIGLSAYSREQNDALSFTGNQAALAQTKQAGIGIFGERRFMLKETSMYALGAAFPSRLGNFGIQLNYAGFKNFNENKIGLAYARRLGKMIDVGVQFNYYGYRVPAYGSASSINFELGTTMHLTNKLNAGIHIYNPIGGRLGKDKEEKSASVYKLGIGYDASDRFYVAAEIIKEEDKAVNVIAGIQYHFARKFFARVGFAGESTSAYAGAGLGWKSLQLSVSSAYHPQLGFSPGILLLVNFKESKE